MAIKRKRLGEILIDAGIINDRQLEEALESQRSLGMKLGEALIHLGYVQEDDILLTMKKQLNIPIIDINRVVVADEVLKLLPEAVARKYEVIPIDINNNRLVVALNDATNYFALDDIRLAVGMMIRPVLARRADILKSIDRHYGRSEAEKAAKDYARQVSPVAAAMELVHPAVPSGAEDEETPVIRFLNTVIENAVHNYASDIHIEQVEEELRVRFRMDGVLREILRTPVTMAGPVVSRVKIMADLNIAERRLPQDGRITFQASDRTVDIRVSIIPTMFGEKVVMRILDKVSVILDKEKLGLKDRDQELFDNLISKPYGIILVTGPTGSGKTTTLYTMLNQLNTEDKNIVTLEDPVEFNFKGINQIQVNAKAGLTFASGLRAILRQDPDIIMVGEMRDNETAEIAVRAALTGHLVLSTVHTNDAASAVTRLIDLNIASFLISASLVGVLSQRLVRTICPNCMEEYEASYAEMNLLGLTGNKVMLKKGKGCNYCHFSGYKGRKGIFEIMPVTHGHRSLIDCNATADELREYALSMGMTTLRDSARKLVLEGTTTIEELLRVTFVNE